MVKFSSKSITITMVTALFLSISIQTQNAGVMGYTQNELEQCYPLLPHRHVMDASGQVYDENGVLTKLTCGDYLRSGASTGNMTGGFYGNVQAQKYYTIDELKQCDALLPTGLVIGPSPNYDVLDRNGSPTGISCKDYIGTPTGNAPIEYVGNMTEIMEGNMTGEVWTENVSSTGVIDYVPVNATGTMEGNMTGEVWTENVSSTGVIDYVTNASSDITGDMNMQIPTLSRDQISPETFQEFGVFIGPIQKGTGVYYNENGVFVPWDTLCSASQGYMLQSCDSLISGGSLTSEGHKAVECVKNGVILTAIGDMFNLQIDAIKGILGALATPTGCDGIVDLNSIASSPDIQRLVDFAGSMAQ